MIARIAFIFALLNIASATGQRSLTFKVEKTFGFLHIFKYVNYNFYVKEIGEDTPKLDAKAAKSDWYFWAGYFEKFQEKKYKVDLVLSINEAAATTTTIEFLDVKSDNTLVGANFALSDECSKAKEVKIATDDKGWKGDKKTINVNLICKGVAEIPEMAKDVINQALENAKQEITEQLPVANLQVNQEIQPEVIQGEKVVVDQQEPEQQVIQPNIQEPVIQQEQPEIQQEQPEIQQPVINKDEVVEEQDQRILL